MYVCMLRVRLGLVLGRHPKINLFGLHYCVICCEVETKYGKYWIFIALVAQNVSLPDQNVKHENTFASKLKSYRILPRRLILILILT